MVSGMDLLDGTPIIDIKPYIPYADHVTGANGGFASTAPQIIDVEFSAQALNQLKTYGHQTNLQQLIQEVLGQDPRPAYHKDPNKVYAMNLYQFNIKWQVIGQTNHVLSVEEEK